jgi:hypothetical protein
VAEYLKPDEQKYRDRVLAAWVHASRSEIRAAIQHLDALEEAALSKPAFSEELLAKARLLRELIAKTLNR